MDSAAWILLQREADLTVQLEASTGLDAFSTYLARWAEFRDYESDHAQPAPPTPTLGIGGAG